MMSKELVRNCVQLIQKKLVRKLLDSKFRPVLVKMVPVKFRKALAQISHTITQKNITQDRVYATLYLESNSFFKKVSPQKHIQAKRVVFSSQQLFRFDNDKAEEQCLLELATYLSSRSNLAIWGVNSLSKVLVKKFPNLLKNVAVFIDIGSDVDLNFLDIPIVKNVDELAYYGIKEVFLSDLSKFNRMIQKSQLSDKYIVIEPDVLQDIAFKNLPMRAWTPTEKHIYPIQIPAIKFAQDLDFILIDCPARNLSMMPNGIGYVHNALKKTSITWQTFDLDIICYHWFHITRIYDQGGRVTLPSGRVLPVDPWLAENYDLWTNDEVIEHFQPLMDKTFEQLVEAKPKVLGFSLHQCNIKFAELLVKRLKVALPEVLIVVGGFSCYHASVGRRVFPDSDYMCISEADLTVGPLLEALSKGLRPFNMPGVLSKFDTPDYKFIPGPVPHNLDLIEFPKYDWIENLNIYRNFNGYQLTPIIASRGCMWSRCTFCAERFFWRIRTAKNFVNEVEWLVNQGCRLFMFNESDLNGRPEVLLEICDEIIRRNIKVKLTGQLRIHKSSDRAFFDKLHAAGFVALRFGVDAFSKNTLKLQKKGYTVETVSQNLKDCWEAGIYTEVNWVIGVPGETWEDVTEGIELILANQKYIGRLANINPLILVNGGVYWLEPEKHNIVLHGDKDELYYNNPQALSADAWHSEDPYIDAQVRKQYFEHIVVTLYERGFQLGDWAKQVVDDVISARDLKRSGATAGKMIKQDEAKLVRVVSNYRIFLFTNNYFAVPDVIQNFAPDLDHDALKKMGILINASLDELVDHIENGNDWANSRGVYDSQETQKKAGAAMRAGSSLIGDHQLDSIKLESGIVVPHEKYHYLVEQDELGTSQLDKNKIFRVVSNVAKPEFLFSIKNYNLVEFDDQFFACKQGRSIDFWDIKVDNENILADENIANLINRVEKLQEKDNVKKMSDSLSIAAQNVNKNTSAPKLIKSIMSYNIVVYEGWVYGIPQNLGPIDLQEVDVFDFPDIIRDLSPTVVEDEITQKCAA